MNPNPPSTPPRIVSGSTVTGHLLMFMKNALPALQSFQGTPCASATIFSEVRFTLNSPPLGSTSILPSQLPKHVSLVEFIEQLLECPVSAAIGYRQTGHIILGSALLQNPSRLCGQSADI